MRSQSIISYITHILFAILFGVGLAWLSWDTASFALGEGFKFAAIGISKVASLRLASNSVVPAKEIKVAVPSPKISRSYIEAEIVDVPTEGKFVAANLSRMTISLFQDGKEIDSVQIGTIGKKGAAWETPRGLYKIETKEENHFSSIGKVYMPFSMQFNGNYFIHGWTYYPDGTLVSADYSGGCIKLKTKDAEKIFRFVSVGTPVYVYSENGDEEEGYFIPKQTNEKINVLAGAYLVADVESGQILAERNRDSILPIGQITQLVSSLVTLDAINFFNHTVVEPGAIKEFSAANLLLPGEKIVVKDLLYPMLFGDNGVAANTLANVMGKEVFVGKMNKRVKSLGLSQTTFSDPAGLTSGNQSSANDLFKLIRHTYFFKNYLWSLTREQSKKSGSHIWHNQNDLSQTLGFQGGLSGKMDDEKSVSTTLVSVKTTATSSRTVAIIVLDSPDARSDVAMLADYVNSYFQFTQKLEVEDATPAPNTNVSQIQSYSTSTVLTFVGDIMLDRGVKKSIINNGAGDYNYAFADLGRFNDTDILFGNLEGPVSDKGQDLKNLYSFRMSPLTISALQNQGFDVLSIANNHMADWTRSAFSDTFFQFSDSNIALAGGGLSKTDATQAKVIEKNGVKFGYIGFSDVGPNAMKAGTTTAGVLLASDPEAPQIIKNASEQCDVLIVSYHFGNEYEKKSNWRQRELAHMAIDNGARIVVGHHPHVAQETETYRGGVIMYSLGNFIFDQYFSADTMSGLAVKITFDGKNISDIKEFKTSLDKNFRVSVE